MGEDKTGLAEQCTLPVFAGRLKPLPFDLENKRVLAFAGIGHPEKFYQTLKSLGYALVATHDLPTIMLIRRRIWKRCGRKRRHRGCRW